jgi:hypothetical protein
MDNNNPNGPTEDYSQDQSVIAELGSGQLTALVMFASEEIMNDEAGPQIHPTLDENRVIVTFNSKIFEWRVKNLFETYSEKRPDVSPGAIMKQCQESMLDAMLKATFEALDDYYALNGLSHLAEPLDD